MKQCSNCKLELDLSFFNQKGLKNDGSVKYQPYCRQCNKIHSKRYYERNRRAHIARIGANNKQYRAVLRDFIFEYLSHHPCVDCANSDLRVLDFDHVMGEKKFSIATLSTTSLDSVKAEVAKCEVRCSNCHRIRHAIKRNTFRQIEYDRIKTFNKETSMTR